MKVCEDYKSRRVGQEYGRCVVRDLDRQSTHYTSTPNNK